MANQGINMDKPPVSIGAGFLHRIISHWETMKIMLSMPPSSLLAEAPFFRGASRIEPTFSP